MVILNFAHPLTPDQQRQIESLTQRSIDQVIAINSQVDPQQPLVTQVISIVEQVGFSPEQWQTLPLLVNPPPLNFVAVILLAELHGRMGYFPAVISLRPAAGSMPRRYEVNEIIDLQELRDEARTRRQQ